MQRENVAPGGLTPVLSSTDVTISGTTVTIDLNHGNVNGYPYYKAASTVAGLATAQPVAIVITPADQVEGLDNGGRITLSGQGGEAAFYQIGISATPIPAPNN